MSYWNILPYLAAVSIKQEELKLPTQPLVSTNLANILRIVFGVAGGIAIIVITIAGLQFTTSSGDPTSTNKAKNAIIYALIGLLVCIFAFSIVSIIGNQRYGTGN